MAGNTATDRKHVKNKNVRNPSASTIFGDKIVWKTADCGTVVVVLHLPTATLFGDTNLGSNDLELNVFAPRATRPSATSSSARGDTSVRRVTPGLFVDSRPRGDEVLLPATSHMLSTDRLGCLW